MGCTILTLLCLWSCIVISTPLTRQQVHKAIQHITNTFNLNGTRQYAYVAVFTQTECDSLSTENNLKILQNEKAADIANALNNGEGIYEGEQMVLATYKEKKMEGEHNIHSEYRLLFPSAGHKRSPVEQLLDRNKNMNKNKDKNKNKNTNTNTAACVIFYTLNSPCVGVCTNTKNDQNIIERLSMFKDFNNNKAFVYSALYKGDLQKKDAIWSGLTEVTKQIDVYRCFPQRCYKCFEKQNNWFIYKGHCIN